MPPSTSPRPKTKAKRQSSDEWVVVAEFSNDAEADERVALLKGSRIPAVRMPPTNIMAVVAPGLTLTHPIVVLVPPDRVADAKELLGDAAMGQSEDGK